MSPRARPRAPWYSPATRRLAIVRIGLPTLLACVIATGPAAAAQAGSAVPPQAAALVTSVGRMLDPPPGGPPADRPAVQLDGGGHGFVDGPR